MIIITITYNKFNGLDDAATDFNGISLELQTKVTAKQLADLINTFEACTLDDSNFGNVCFTVPNREYLDIVANYITNKFLEAD